MEKLIYHMCRADEWNQALRAGSYSGSSQDQADGFIHFSTAHQVRVSAAKHRAGQDNLILLEVDSERLGNALKWEESRGGALFPHLYGELPTEAVKAASPLLLDEDNMHVFPDHIPSLDAEGTL